MRNIIVVILVFLLSLSVQAASPRTVTVDPDTYKVLYPTNIWSANSADISAIVTGTNVGSWNVYLSSNQVFTGSNRFSGPVVLDQVMSGNLVTNIDISKTRFFVIGDSLSADPAWLYWLTNNTRYASVWSTNSAVAGSGLNAAFMAILTNNIIPLRNTNYTDILFWWGGANEHPYYTAAEYAYDPGDAIGSGGHSNACVLIKNAGFKLVLFSTLPRNVLTTFNRQETNRFQYNEWFEQCGLWDYYVDTAAFFSNNKGSLFSDGTHLTTNSYRIVADLVDQALRMGSRNTIANFQPYSGWSQVGTNFVLQAPDGSIIATADASGRLTFVNSLAWGATVSDPMITRSAGQIYFRTGDNSSFVPVRASQFIATDTSGLNPLEINTNYLVVTSLGRVGIGTASPATTLDVSGEVLSKNNASGFRHIGTNSGFTIWLDATPTKAGRMRNNTSGDLMLDVYDGSAWNNELTIENASKAVKIGTNYVVFAPGQGTNWVGGLTVINQLNIGTYTNLNDWAKVPTNAIATTNWVEENFLDPNFNTDHFTITAVTNIAINTNNIASVEYVNSLLSFGGIYYNTTNLHPDNTNYFAFVFNELPTNDNVRTYTVLTNNQYVGSVMTTNSFTTLSAPVSVNSYLTKGAAGSLTLRAEIYYTYDNGTNLLGDFQGDARSISTGTNLYTWVVTFPTIMSTNATGFKIVRRLKVVSQTTTPDLTISIGTNTPSHIHLQSTGGATSGGDVYLASNNVMTGASNQFTAEIQANSLVLTNNITRPITWLTATSADSNFVANADIARSGIWCITNINWLHVTNMPISTNWQKDIQITIRNYSGYNLTNTVPTTWKRVGTAQTVLSNNTVSVMAISAFGDNQTNIIYAIATP